MRKFSYNLISCINSAYTLINGRSEKQNGITTKPIEEKTVQETIFQPPQ